LPKDVLGKLYLFPSFAILLLYSYNNNAVMSPNTFLTNEYFVVKKWTVSFPVRNVYSEKMNDVLQNGHCPTYSLCTSQFKHSKTTYIVTTYLNTICLVNFLNSNFGTKFTQKRRTECGAMIFIVSKKYSDKMRERKAIVLNYKLAGAL